MERTTEQVGLRQRLDRNFVYKARRNAVINPLQQINEPRLVMLGSSRVSSESAAAST
jgi:hypothetical protein